MQSYSEVLSYEGYTPEQFSLLVQLAMKRLQWRILMIADNEIKSVVPSSSWSWGEVVTVQVYEQEVWVTSKYKQWTLPLENKHQQNCQAFANVMAQLQYRYPADVLAGASWEALLGEEEKESVSLQANTSIRANYAMYGLAIVIIAVFVTMLCRGVAAFDPNVDTLFAWGGNFAPAVFTGEYWRLFTSLFVHAGVSHLVLNLAALFVIGLHLEPLIGRGRFILCFLLTGLVAGTVSIWWHANTISVGASGAIFGLYGVFLSLLLTGAAGKQLKMNLLGSMVFFVVVNLVYGLKEGIDNAAHIGGLLSGLLLGGLLVVEWKQKRLRWLWRSIGVALPLLLTIPYLVYSQRTEVVTKPAGEVALVGRLQEIMTLDQKALWPIATADGKSVNQVAGEIERESIPSWTAVSNILAHYEQRPLDSFNRRLQLLLANYTRLRLKECALYIQRADDSLNFSPQELANVQEQVKERQKEIQQMKW
ncbi:MAG TPA: rhomboid family intramembrane serine protease [Flavisolibacter sp.]|nr:rhomboid family intramembrane serine protease [Flavisolibacter sp.]